MSRRLPLIAAAALAAALSAVPSAAQPPCYAYRGAPAQVVGNYGYYAPAHDYQVPVQKITANDVAVAPLLVTVPVDSYAAPVGSYGVPYYYSVGDAYREKAYIRDVIREELRAIAAGTAPQPTAPPPAAQYQTQRPAPAAGQPSEADAADDVTPPDLQQKVLAAYQGRGNCLSCHGGQAKFRLVDDQGRLLKKASDKRWKIYGMSSVGAMPPAAVNDANKAMEAAHLPVLLQYVAIK